MSSIYGYLGWKKDIQDSAVWNYIYCEEIAPEVLFVEKKCVMSYEYKGYHMSWKSKTWHNMTSTEKNRNQRFRKEA
jgi:hypothetical protein